MIRSSVVYQCLIIGTFNVPNEVEERNNRENYRLDRNSTRHNRLLPADTTSPRGALRLGNQHLYLVNLVVRQRASPHLLHNPEGSVDEHSASDQYHCHRNHYCSGAEK
jgi:hypothetical protein